MIFGRPRLRDVLPGLLRELWPTLVATIVFVAVFVLCLSFLVGVPRAGDPRQTTAGAACECSCPCR